MVAGKLLVKGYEVLDPPTGAVIRRDSEARGRLDLPQRACSTCAASTPRDCTLTAWDPRGTTPLWTVALPGIGFVLFADNPDILGTQPLTAEADRRHRPAART